MKWLSEVDDAMPSVVIAPRDALGTDLVAARVTIDDQDVANAASTRATQRPRWEDADLAA
jgi:hypothetical protein